MTQLGAASIQGWLDGMAGLTGSIYGPDQPEDVEVLLHFSDLLRRFCPLQLARYGQYIISGDQAVTECAHVCSV